jgi:hypothetical protein
VERVGIEALENILCDEDRIFKVMRSLLEIKSEGVGRERK